jgi:hypothetical protein
MAALSPIPYHQESFRVFLKPTCIHSKVLRTLGLSWGDRRWESEYPFPIRQRERRYYIGKQSHGWQ